MKTKLLLITTAALALAACSNANDKAAEQALAERPATTAAANEASLKKMKAEMGITEQAAPKEMDFPVNEPEMAASDTKVEVSASDAPELVKVAATAPAKKTVTKEAKSPATEMDKAAKPALAKSEEASEPVQMASAEETMAKEEAPQEKTDVDNSEDEASKETSESDESEETAQDSSSDEAAADTQNNEEADMPADPWTQILQAYTVKDGSLVRFDYAALSKNTEHMGVLKNYIDDLAGQKPSSMSCEEGLAYWANLYNALTVQVVAENWPVKSIKEIKSGTFTAGPWKRDIVTVEGRTLSLDGIEHDTMRKTWDEPRIHYMVNCASVGCPNLMQKAWSADTLEADMNAAAADYINSNRGGIVSGNSVKISSIFKWYKEDFGGNNSGIIAHMKKYATGDKKAALEGVSKVSGDEYDWSVNAGSAPKDGMKKISAEKMKDLK